jgi:hypothetical protein
MSYASLTSCTRSMIEIRRMLDGHAILLPSDFNYCHECYNCQVQVDTGCCSREDHLMKCYREPCFVTNDMLPFMGPDHRPHGKRLPCSLVPAS